MQLIAPLPRKVEHQEGEPAYSLLVRTLEHNGSRRIGPAIDRVVGARARAPSRWDPSEIARICKADLQAVRHATPVVGSKTAEVMGQALLAEQVGIGTRRWCPACLAGRPHHRVWWDILPVTSCPEHGTKLTASCGCKGRSLQWRSGPLRHCPAGHPLEGVACTEADPDVLAFDAYVVARLRGDDSERSHEFDDVGLGELIAICERLGKASLDEGRTIYVVRKSYDTGRLHAEGFRILLGLPTTFTEVLDRVRSGEATRSHASLLRRTYGELYRFVRGLPDHPVGVALRTALAEHARTNLPVKNGTLLDGRTPHVSGGAALTAAASAIGLRYERFVGLVDQLGVPREERGGSSEISLADLDRLKERLVGFRSLQQVGAELGLAAQEVVGLASGGLLDIIATGRGSAGWMFPANAATELLAKLHSKAGKPGPTPGRFVSLPLAARHHGASVEEILRLVLQGSVEVRARWARRRGVAGLHVDPHSLPRHLPPVDDAGVPVAVAARELRLSLPAIDRILATSLLRTETVDDIDRVPTHEIERFHSAWATMPELRGVMGVTAWLPVATTLAAAGVNSPLAGAPLSERIYPRESAVRACAAAAEELARTTDRGLDRGAVATTLNLPKLMVQQLVEAGLISIKERCRFGSVSAEELERFKETYVTLPELAAAFELRSPRAVLSILDEVGVEAACRRPRFCSYLFLRTEAYAALRHRTEALNAAPPTLLAADQPMLAVPDVAARLGTGEHMVLQLAANGLLGSTRLGQSVMVPASEVERFSRKYVFANELARNVGRTHRHGVGAAVTKKLLRAGIQPVCSKPKFVNFVFDRDEATTGIRRLGIS